MTLCIFDQYFVASPKSVRQTHTCSVLIRQADTDTVTQIQTGFECYLDLRLGTTCSWDCTESQSSPWNSAYKIHSLWKYLNKHTEPSVESAPPTNMAPQSQRLLDWGTFLSSCLSTLRFRSFEVFSPINFLWGLSTFGWKKTPQKLTVELLNCQNTLEENELDNSTKPPAVS